MEPEISHRCPACGVSVRGKSLFCPQCGRPLKTGATGVGDKAAGATEATTHRKPDAGLNTSVIAPSSNLAETAPGQETVQPKTTSSSNNVNAGVTKPLARDVEERARPASVTSVRRDKVEAKSTPRVEKLRHASSAMLEEASTDPGLRFILVAIVVFLLSLLLLLLNRLLG